VFFKFKKGRLDVYPSVVEDCLLKHANVLEAIVFGISVNAFEQDVCVRLKSTGVGTSETELVGHCEKHLIDYQVPRRVKLVDSFPTNRMGKYDRLVISSQYKRELGV
jgi:acyl-CoA synthetase (AMP-forming)/AMP-acid ligase II